MHSLTWPPMFFHFCFWCVEQRLGANEQQDKHTGWPGACYMETCYFTSNCWTLKPVRPNTHPERWFVSMLMSSCETSLKRLTFVILFQRCCNSTESALHSVDGSTCAHVVPLNYYLVPCINTLLDKRVLWGQVGAWGRVPCRTFVE